MARRAGAAEAAPFRQGPLALAESYFGPRRLRGQRGRGAAKQIPAIGRLKRDGKVFAQTVPNCSGAELLSVFRGRVRRPAVIHTDSGKASDGLVRDGFRHHRVHHPANGFARGRRHINGLESFCGYAKTRLAKQRGTRIGKFHDHLKETERPWNHRRENLHKRLLNETRRHPPQLGMTQSFYHRNCPDHIAWFGQRIVSLPMRTSAKTQAGVQILTAA